MVSLGGKYVFCGGDCVFAITCMLCMMGKSIIIIINIINDFIHT